MTATSLSVGPASNSGSGSDGSSTGASSGTSNSPTDPGSSATDNSGSTSPNTTVPDTSSGDQSTGDPTNGTSTTNTTNNTTMPAMCGNGAIDPNEQCDGANLNGFDCASLGAGTGTLGCDPATCTFDTSMCDGGGGTSG